MEYKLDRLYQITKNEIKDCLNIRRDIIYSGKISFKDYMDFTRLIERYMELGAKDYEYTQYIQTLLSANVEITSEEEQDKYERNNKFFNGLIGCCKIYKR